MPPQKNWLSASHNWSIAVAIHVRTLGVVVASSANVLSPDGFSL
jgi:hypothetical protein